MKKNIVQRSQNTLKCGLVTLIALVFLLSANQSGAAVGDIFTDDNFKYTVLTEEGTTGTVSVAKQSADTIPPREGTAIPSSVKYGSVTYSVTYIGDLAFWACYGLTSITIPDSVTSIGYGAFWGCSLLKNITIPDSVTNIGYQPFYGCNQLPPILFSTGGKVLVRYSDTNTATEYSIPDTVTYIANSAFQDCSSLTSITIPDSVTSIGWGAFSGCRSLTSVTIPDSVTSIEGDAFKICSSLTSITIPDSVTSIGYSAFSYCSSLTSVTIPDSVTSIEPLAFQGCGSLTDITIPDNVTSIGYNAFELCGCLTSITIPNSVTSIGWGAFRYCGNLKTVYFKGDAPELGGWVFFDDDPILYYIEGASGWTTPYWNGYHTATWIPEGWPLLSFDVKKGKLILTYSGGSLQASSDLIFWSPVEGALEGKYEVNLPKTGKTFYRIAQ